jgi:hypothetical protein
MPAENPSEVVDTGQPAGLPADGVAAAEPAGDTPQATIRTSDHERAAIIQRYTESNRAAQDSSLNAARGASEAAMQEGSDGVSARAASAGNGSQAADASPPDTSSTPVEKAAAPESETAAPALRTVTVKVYGTTLEVPMSTVEAAGGIAAYQKQLAVDDQLRRASILTKKLEEQLNSGQNATSAAPATTTAAASPPSGEQAAVGGKEAAREALEALLESDADRFSTALGKAIEGTVQERLREAKPAATTAEAPATTSRSAEEIAAANDVFAQEFSHLAKRPEVFQAAQELMRARMSSPEFASVPLDMLARDVGARVMKLTGAPLESAPAKADTPARPRADVASRLEVRRTVKARLPAAASTTAASSTPNPPKSRAQGISDYIKTLRSRSGSNSAIAERGAR